jgi:hypothetical protein
MHCTILPCAWILAILIILQTVFCACGLMISR